jgi:hypothetical protein
MTKQLSFIVAAITLCTLVQTAVSAEKNAPQADKQGWISLFDGKTFDGWKINENKDSWSIEGGCLVAKGPRSHLFYTGRSFKNFEFKADVKTEPGSNSGIFFHTKFQPEGWPAQGYESQVNVSHGDPVKTGSLYNTVKLFETPAKDNQWWTQTITVKDKHVTVKVNDKTVLEYDEPADKEGLLKLSEGTFALQAHDPKSVVRFKNLMVKPLD